MTVVADRQQITTLPLEKQLGADKQTSFAQTTRCGETTRCGKQLGAENN